MINDDNYFPSMNVASVSLALAVISTALITGLFYGYSCSVNPGLARLSDNAYLAAMQNINRAIQNPLFFSSFFGALLLLPVAAFFNYQIRPARCYLLLVATLVYAAGVIGITVACNIPFNNTLDSLSLNGISAPEAKAARLAFEGSWNKWHAVRTLFSTLALILSVWACLLSRVSDRSL
jgi:uncharacterized membrane protein